MDDHRCPPPRLPGLEPVRLLGIGGQACVWLADPDPDAGPGRPASNQFAIKVAHSGDRTAAAAVQAEARSLRRVSHPNVVRLLDARRTDAGAPALVLEHAAGGSLADLLGRRPGLAPGEVATVVIALCRALAALHAAGLVHDDVTPGNVLFDARGRPILADLGSARLVADPDEQGEDLQALGHLIGACLALGARSAASPASPMASTAALRALADRLIGSPGGLTAEGVERELWRIGAPRPVRGWPVRAPSSPTSALGGPPSRAPSSRAPSSRAPSSPAPVSRPDPTRRRPRAAAARSVGSSDPPAPAPGGPGERPRHRASRRRPRAGRRGVAMLAPVVGVAALVVLWGGRFIDPATGRVAESVAAPSIPGQATVAAVVDADLLPVVRTLAARRAEALGGRPELLAQVDVADSPAMAADRALLDRLAGRQQRLHDLTFAVQEVRAAGKVAANGAADETAVVARVATSAHRRVDATGRVVASVPATAATTVRLILRRVDGDWRVYDTGPLG